jgi:hypothetical protein
MTGQPTTLPEEATVAEAAKGMETKTSEMSSSFGKGRGAELATLSPDDSIPDAVRIMRKRAIRRIPVVEDGSRSSSCQSGTLAIERDTDSALADIGASSRTSSSALHGMGYRHAVREVRFLLQARRLGGQRSDSAAAHSIGDFIVATFEMRVRPTDPSSLAGIRVGLARAWGAQGSNPPVGD